jgi:salicylate hydroxylase
LPIGPAELARWQAPYLHVHRADLVDVLARALVEATTDCVHLGAKVETVKDEAAGVTVTLGDGRQIQADALIGADGIHSVVRAYLLGPDQPRFTGNVAWRAVVPMDRLGAHAPPPTACVWVGPGRHAVTYRLAGGRLANFVGVVETSVEPDETWRTKGSKAQASADFSGFAAPVTTLIEQTDDLFLWALRDRAPLARWHRGRIGLLGDSAHPMLPFLAQGASMAIEDAWVLAGCLKAHGVQEGLARYEAIRKPRATRVQSASRANMGLFHRQSAISQLASYGPAWLAGKVAPSVLQARNDWIYAYDVINEVPGL